MEGWSSLASQFSTVAVDAAPRARQRTYLTRLNLLLRRAPGTRSHLGPSAVRHALLRSRAYILAADGSWGLVRGRARLPAETLAVSSVHTSCAILPSPSSSLPTQAYIYCRTSLSFSLRRAPRSIARAPPPAPRLVACRERPHSTPAPAGGARRAHTASRVADARAGGRPAIPRRDLSRPKPWPQPKPAHDDDTYDAQRQRVRLGLGRGQRKRRELVESRARARKGRALPRTANARA